MHYTENTAINKNRMGIRGHPILALKVHYKKPFALNQAPLPRLQILQRQY